MRNVLLVLTPVAVCVALLVLQVLANGAIRNASGDSSGRCGCRCLRCCGYYANGTSSSLEYSCHDDDDGDGGACLPSNYTECLAYDNSECGIEFSTEAQAVYCEVQNPITWPALVQVSDTDEIAAKYAPASPVLYTGADRADADALAGGILPAANPGNLGALLGAGGGTPTGGDNSTSSGADLETLVSAISDALESSGALLGTSADAFYSLYVEPGLIPSGGSSDSDEVTTVYFLLEDCSAIADQLLEAIDDASRIATGLSLQCREMPIVWRNNSAAISAEIYCSNPAATCIAVGNSIVQLDDVPTNLSGLVDQLSTLPVSYNASAAASGDDNSDNDDDDRSAISGLNTDKIYRADVVAPTEAFSSLLYDFKSSKGVAGGPFDVMLWYYNNDLANGVKEPPVINRVNAAVNRASQSYLSLVASSLGLENADAYAVTLRGLQGMPKPETRLSLDFSTLLGPLFYLWLLQTLLPIQAMIIVDERERGFRAMMRIHGLGDVAYWLSQIIGHLVLYDAFAISFFIIGQIVGLLFFTSNNVLIQLILYALWGCTQVSLAALLSTLFGRAQTAMIAVTLWVFASGLFASVYMQNLLETGTDWVVWLQIIPSFALYRGLYELSSYAFLAARNGNDEGMSWSDLENSGNGMTTVWIMLAVEAVVMLIVALLLERYVVHRSQIGAGSVTGRRRWLWPWRRRARASPVHATPRGSGAHGIDEENASMARKLSAHGHTAPDIAMERDHAAQSLGRILRSGGVVSKSRPVVVAHRLRKVYGNRRTPACSDLSLTIARSECFGMLGPNGAGKTTTIAMLTGQLRPTSGSVFIRGERLWHTEYADDDAPRAGRKVSGPGFHDDDDDDDDDDDINAMQNRTKASRCSRTSRSSARRSNATDRDKDAGRQRPLIGLCPQHDRLWPHLNAEEHLLFYGKIRGIDAAEITTVIAMLLYTLNLNHSGIPLRPVHTYSGGMKRRLSVAIALLGDPDVAFLDEPSSGLDPGSRRALWDAILESIHERGITVMLTTHSMEEAEALCDRIGIFADGSMKCIGSPHELTARYGRFQTLSLTTTEDEEDVEAVPGFVNDALGLDGRAQKKYQLAGTFRYDIPASDVSLATLFRQFEAHRLRTPSTGGHVGADSDIDDYDDDSTGGGRAAAGGLHASGMDPPQILEWEIKGATLEDVFHAVTDAGAHGAATEDDPFLLDGRSTSRTATATTGRTSERSRKSSVGADPSYSAI